MGLFSSKREDPKEPFRTPRNPRPKGGQKGVTKRDNGRESPFENARKPNPNASKGWPFHW